MFSIYTIPFDIQKFYVLVKQGMYVIKHKENIVKHNFIHLPMKMELIEGSETSAIRTQTPGNYPKEIILHIEHGESLKSRNTSTLMILLTCILTLGRASWYSCIER